MTEEKENILATNNNVLVCIDVDVDNLDPLLKKEFEYIKRNFCGIVLTDANSYADYAKSNCPLITYFCGTLQHFYEQLQLVPDVITVIKELSCNYEDIRSDHIELIDLGQVPINVHNVGVYFRNCFDSTQNYFDLISTEHQFQTLTDSNKPSNAFRTGIYLSKVEKNNDDSLSFNLLRCSSNLGGPTANFGQTDDYVVDHVNNLAGCFFFEETDLNHVLAQIYENTSNEGVDKKAKIKEHSDKTKDMPRNGLMAFTTFYKGHANNNFDPKVIQLTKSTSDLFDWTVNNVSSLTRLRFRLKTPNPNYVDKFDIVLYPNSVFIMSLSSNRLYTHEIVPSVLSVDKIPTRLGYVIRCSKTKAIYKDNQTYIIDNDQDTVVTNNNYVKLEKPDQEGIKELKDLYFKENTSDELITYRKFYFSLNNGDYERPLANSQTLQIS